MIEDMAPEEFSRTYLPFKGELYRIARRLLASEEAAADAVQDVYLKLWDSRDSLDAVRNPKAWSATMMRNLCIDRLRAATPPAAGNPDPETPEPETESGPTERQERALAAVRRLTPQERELVRLRLIEGCSYEEIAQRKGQSEVAMRVAFHRLKNKLKRMI